MILIIKNVNIYITILHIYIHLDIFLSLGINMKPIMRTTVILDEELRKKLKMLSVQKDISMKEIITQSLEEKIKRELEGTDTRDEFEDNKIISAINKKIESVFGSATTRVLLVQICKKFDVSPTSYPE